MPAARSLDPTEDLALQLVRRFLLLCEHPRTRQRMLRMVRQAASPGATPPRIYAWMNRALQRGPLAGVVGARSVSAIRVEMVASQLVGLAMSRYVLRLEPLASASVDEVVLLAAPGVAATLQGQESLRGLVREPVVLALPTPAVHRRVASRVGRGVQTGLVAPVRVTGAVVGRITDRLVTPRGRTISEVDR